MIHEDLLAKIEVRFGRSIRYSKDCDALAVDIIFHTGCRISASTLKRVLGFGDNYIIPRLYTLDAIAKYIGYDSWNDLPYLGEDDSSHYKDKVKVVFMTGEACIVSRYDNRYSRIISHTFIFNPHVFLIAGDQLSVGNSIKLFHSDVKKRIPKSLTIKSLEIL